MTYLAAAMRLRVLWRIAVLSRDTISAEALVVASLVLVQRLTSAEYAMYDAWVDATMLGAPTSAISVETPAQPRAITEADAN